MRNVQPSSHRIRGLRNDVLAVGRLPSRLAQDNTSPRSYPTIKQAVYKRCNHTLIADGIEIGGGCMAVALQARYALAS